MWSEADRSDRRYAEKGKQDPGSISRMVACPFRCRCVLNALPILGVLATHPAHNPEQVEFVGVQFRAPHDWVAVLCLRRRGDVKNKTRFFTEFSQPRAGSELTC